jgi:hypothetical protein
MFKNWLRACADYCDLEKRTLVPALLIIHQIQDAQIERIQAVNALKSVTNCDTDAANAIFASVAKYRGQNLSYRKWLITVAPFPSTAHFEYLAFGKRVDKRSRWAQAGNKTHAAAFASFKQWRRLRITPDDISRLPDNEVGRIVAGALCSFENGEYKPGASDSWFEPQQSAAISPAGDNVQKSTHRSRSNAARHNVKRFAEWISKSESPRVQQEIRSAWDSARWDFKRQVQDHLGEERIQQFLRDTDPAGSSTRY